MRMIISTDAEKCNGCGVCELICSASKEGVFNKRLSRIRVVSIEPTIDMAVACRFCEDPPCVKSCPRKALFRDSNGIILVEETKCNGCGWCIEACDFGAIQLHPFRHHVIVCDLCDGEPKCIKWCPAGALQLVPLSTVTGKARVQAVTKLFNYQSNR